MVKPGILYRSGQLTRPQLARAVAEYGIGTVVNLQLPDKELRGAGAGEEARGRLRESAHAGDGFGEESQFRKVLELSTTPRVGRRWSIVPGDMPHRFDGGPVPV